MKTVKDILNIFPRYLIKVINNDELINSEDGFIQLVSQDTGNIYNTEISIPNFKKIESLIKNIAKYIPDNWTDRIISLDRIKKMPDIKYWISDNTLFYNIIQYVSQDEYQQLIFEMISCFNLDEANQVKNALINNDEKAFCNLMLKYDSNKRYRKFVAKCGALLLLRRFLFLELNNPKLKTEFADIQKKLFEIKRNSGDIKIIEAKDFLDNPKIDEQEKINYLKRDFLCNIDFLDYLNVPEVETELSNHIDIKSKINIIGNHIKNTAILYYRNQEGCSIIKKTIEKCPLTEVQLRKLYETLSQNGDITAETSEQLFTNIFSGQEINADEKIVFAFKNQYSFKFLIQEMYEKNNKEIKETPPNGIEVGAPSDIFFYHKCGTLRPLKFQKENDSEFSQNAQKERERIADIIENIKHITA